MLDRAALVKQKLKEAIAQLCQASWMFSKQPGKDFSRTKKLPFSKVISFLLAIEGGTLTNELLKFFGCSVKTASASAFTQQRSKLAPETLPTLFDLFVQKTQPTKLYKDFHLLAADGSDILIPGNSEHTASYFPGANGRASYHILHLDAVYDLLQHTYRDASVVGVREANENATLCRMIDRSAIKKAILIADRGYESFNLMAHIQEKNWKYLIRVKDVGQTGGIAAGLTLPKAEEFDVLVDLSLTTKQTNKVKELFKRKNQYRYISSSQAFDFLPKKNRKRDPAAFYKLPFRIARFKITDDTYETVVTNLDAADFPSPELKKLYAMRWGVETSFRELKHTVGLLHFHAKKAERIYQEIFARLIMYNFTELITSPVIFHKVGAQYAYQANFTVAVHVCRQFFLGNASPPDVEAVICRNVSPVRPGRRSPRSLNVRRAVSFTYRVA